MKLKRATKLYEAFREETPRRAIRTHIPSGYYTIMGHVRAVEYDTTHRGRVHLYKHTFAAGSRPLLIAGKRGQLYLLNGRFHVTGRGIVDLDASGREIEDGRRRK